MHTNSKLIEGNAMPDLSELKAELRYCLENGMFGPRTGAALQWALEELEKITEEGEK
jgi:hypothetical protein